MDRERFIRDTAQKLIDQGQFSFNADEIRCSYRDPDGNRCAIGLHFRKNADVHAVEGLNVRDAYTDRPALFKTMIRKYGEFEENDLLFLCDVQSRLHDDPHDDWNSEDVPTSPRDYMLTPEAAVALFKEIGLPRGLR